MEDQKTVIYRFFSTISIALDENFGAKIVDFGKSIFLPPNHDIHYFGTIFGSTMYTDPEYLFYGTLKRESDVYAFGVVLFEIFCGRLAIDKMYLSDVGLAYVARRCFRKGTIMEMIDPRIKEEGPNKDSIDTFLKIAYWCLAETQDQRPTMKDVVKELEKAFPLQRGLRMYIFDLLGSLLRGLEFKLDH
ncbi:receptor-like protein kinase ANXUR2 [Rutidosis leptorrhynchoides]|uniref:receptor-like protein kinase ANXUR2 n=1 Tax=Rutidosis leptorrhynchoides TaxID=125765 RepID=UPI003A99ECC7